MEVLLVFKNLIQMEILLLNGVPMVQVMDSLVVSVASLLIFLVMFMLQILVILLSVSKNLLPLELI